MSMIARFASEPALVSPGHADRFKACLDALAAHPRAQDFMSEPASYNDDGFWPEPESWKAVYRPYVVRDGILQIPIKGVLLHDFAFTTPWATGYDYIWRAFQRGCGEFKTGLIKGIALIIDSPGGMVAGCFDSVDKAFALKIATKVPVRAFAQESAYSAAYAWFTVGDHGNVSRTGGVGSIGVVTTHIDVSKAVDEAGYKITFIHAGKHKVDGNPYEPLPDDVKARIQARIDELYQVFVSTVARNRPQLSEEEIRATEALCFTATQAVSEKLADSIGSLDDSLAAFASDLTSTDGEDNIMTTKTHDQAEVDAAVNAAITTEKTNAATAQAAAVAEAVKADRDRQKVITGCEEAKGRESLASHFALNTNLSVEDVKAALAAAPKIEAAPAAIDPAAPFNAAMTDGNPEVGAAAGSGTPAANDDASADVMALVRGAGVVGFNAKK